MGLSSWLSRKFGGGRELDDPSLTDTRVAQAVSALMCSIRLTDEGSTVEGTGLGGPVMRTAEMLKELHLARPNVPALHYAYAAALQVALQGASAEKVLTECGRAHPQFWPAQITLEQKAVLSWNPFFLPEVVLKSDTTIHPVIDGLVRTNVLLATRQGLLPRAVLFLRDQNDEFAVSTLNSCRMEFLTTISTVTRPQVIVINGRIHDNPKDPYQIEVTQCPFRPFGRRERLPYELLVRQKGLDFVILSPSGRIKFARRLSISARMNAVHSKLLRMLQTTEGPDLSVSELITAQRAHQATFDPKTIKY